MGATPSLNTLPMHTKLPNYLGRSWPMSQTNLLHLNIQNKHWSIFHNIHQNPQHFLLKFSLHNFQLCTLVGPSVQLWIQTQSTTATANYHRLDIATIRFIYMIASLKNTCSTLNGDNIFYMQSIQLWILVQKLWCLAAHQIQRCSTWMRAVNSKKVYHIITI